MENNDFWNRWKKAKKTLIKHKDNPAIPTAVTRVELKARCGCSLSVLPNEGTTECHPQADYTFFQPCKKHNNEYKQIQNESNNKDYLRCVSIDATNPDIVQGDPT